MKDLIELIMILTEIVILFAALGLFIQAGTTPYVRV